MILLNDLPLEIPSKELLDTIHRDISLEKLALFFSRAWPGFGTVGLALPTMYRPWPPNFCLNTLLWPSGATRWGQFIGLAHVDDVNELHDALFSSDGSQTIPADLVISSEDAAGDEIESIHADGMTVFPPIPLYRVLNEDNTSDGGVYLLVCVDLRYYWWQYPTPDFGITESAGKTWSNLFTMIGTTLGVTITPDTIDPKYLNPSRALNLTNEPIPIVLQAICSNIGHQLVVDFNGDVKTQSFKTALTALRQDAVDQQDIRTIRAGGGRYLLDY